MSVLDGLIAELKRLRGGSGGLVLSHETDCTCPRCDPSLHASMRAIQRAEDGLQAKWDREDADAERRATEGETDEPTTTGAECAGEGEHDEQG